MFLTGQASNPIIARFVRQETGVEITYAGWVIAASLPALLSLLLVPWLLYRVFPPEIKHTPAARELASTGIEGDGSHEVVRTVDAACVSGLVAMVWMTSRLR